jgi:hypothetical protein
VKHAARLEGSPLPRPQCSRTGAGKAAAAKPRPAMRQSVDVTRSVREPPIAEDDTPRPARRHHGMCDRTTYRDHSHLYAKAGARKGDHPHAVRILARAWAEHHLALLADQHSLQHRRAGRPPMHSHSRSAFFDGHTYHTRGHRRIDNRRSIWCNSDRQEHDLVASERAFAACPVGLVEDGLLHVLPSDRNGYLLLGSWIRFGRSTGCGFACEMSGIRRPALQINDWVTLEGFGLSRTSDGLNIG